MKWTLILLIVVFNSPLKSQDFARALNKNENQNLSLHNPHSSLHFSSNNWVIAVNQNHSDFNDINSISQKRRTDILTVATSKKKASKNGSISKMYVKLYGGYGIFTPGSFKVNSVYFLHDTAVQTQGKKGLGNGLRFGGGIGFVMNDFLNFGLDAEYHKGSWTENHLNARIDDLNYNIRSSEMNYKTLSLTPYVIFKALAKPNYFIYNKLGILLTLPYTLRTSLQSTNANKLDLENGLNTFIQNSNTTTSEEYKISFGVGLNVALGANFRVNESLRIFSEIFGNYSALSPTSSVKVDYNKRFASLSFNSDNTQSQVIKQISTITTNTTYETGGSLPVNGTYRSFSSQTADDYTKTDVVITTLAHKFTINMAVVGVNLGVIYRF